MRDGETAARKRHERSSAQKDPGPSCRRRFRRRYAHMHPSSHTFTTTHALFHPHMSLSGAGDVDAEPVATSADQSSAEQTAEVARSAAPEAATATADAGQRAAQEAADAVPEAADAASTAQLAASSEPDASVQGTALVSAERSSQEPEAEFNPVPTGWDRLLLIAQDGEDGALTEEEMRNELRRRPKFKAATMPKSWRSLRNACALRHTKLGAYRLTVLLFNHITHHPIPNTVLRMGKKDFTAWQSSHDVPDQDGDADGGSDEGPDEGELPPPSPPVTSCSSSFLDCRLCHRC